MKKRAFTLSEILISMVIIGVVSMLMVPVMQNVQEKTLEVGTAHFHSMMMQAIRHYMVDNNAESLCSTKMCFKPTDDSDLNSSSNNSRKAIEDFMYKYLNVAKVCTYSSMGDCVSTQIKNVSNYKSDFYLQRAQYYNYDNSTTNKETVDFGDTLRLYVLENGNVIYMVPPSNIRPAVIQVDINGKKGPNKVGRDIWQMSIYADGSVSDGIHRYMMKEDYRENPTSMKNAIADLVHDKYLDCTITNKVWKYGGGCFARFESNGFKFDY